MWAKIVAGVVAALAVVGVGVYVANPSSGGSCGKCRTAAPQNDTTSAEESVCPVAGSTSAPCCNLAKTKPVDSNAFAACGGGLTAVQATNATAKIACCSE